jgi:hypothetical protein
VRSLGVTVVIAGVVCIAAGAAPSVRKRRASPPTREQCPAYGQLFLMQPDGTGARDITPPGFSTSSRRPGHPTAADRDRRAGAGRRRPRDLPRERRRWRPAAAHYQLPPRSHADLVAGRPQDRLRERAQPVRHLFDALGRQPTAWERPDLVVGVMLGHSRSSARNRCTDAGLLSKERVDRTQEVAGSSPASSMKPRPLLQDAPPRDKAGATGLAVGEKRRALQRFGRRREGAAMKAEESAFKSCGRPWQA